MIDNLPPAGTILLGATPIGNHLDASPRLIEALTHADLIAAEDTRRVLALCSRLDVTIHGRLLSFHEHNEADRVTTLLDAAESGERVLVVSDAGMPTVSDPGYRLVATAAQRAIPVTVIPGPSAVLTALALSGLATDRFSFEGFVPRKPGERRARLEALATEARTMVFFESAQRIGDTLVEMRRVFGDNRRAALCRELTKTYESVVRASLAELQQVSANGVLGEISLVVEGARQGDTVDPRHVDAVRAIAADGVRLKDAAKHVAALTGRKANDLYRQALADSSATSDD